MQYAPYLDSKRLRDRIVSNYTLGTSPSEMAKKFGVSRQLISYHLRKLGLSRPKVHLKKDHLLCVVCRTRPVSTMYRHICTNADCVDVFHHTAACSASVMSNIGDRFSHVSSEEKILLDIVRRTDVVFPKDAEVCVKDDVTRVFSSVADHIRYHAYREYLYEKRPKPPPLLWKNPDEDRLYKMRIRDAEYARKNLSSESPQPRSRGRFT